MRGIIIGVIFSIIIGIAGPYGEFFIKGSSLCYNAIPIATVFPFFLLALLNLCLIKINKKLALNEKELLLVYCMGLVASFIPTGGFTGSLLPLILTPFYYATPNNHWDILFQPNIKKFIIPQNIEKIKYFFEGLPQNEKIPFGDWIIPLIFWGIFLLIIFFLFLSLTSLLSERWNKEEKLTFPLCSVPLSLSSENSILLKNKVFWVGFSIVFMIHSFNALGNFFPIIHPIKLGYSISIQRLLYIPIVINFTMLGFAFLIPTNISFSLWFFFLLLEVEWYFFSKVGFDIVCWDIGSLELWLSYGTVSTTYQQFGALLVLGFILVYQIIKYRILKLRKIKNEIYFKLLPKDFLVFIFSFFSLLFLFRVVLGISTILSFLILLFGLIVYICLAKIIASSGVTTAQTPLIPQTFFSSIFPVPFIAKNITGLSLSTIFIGETGTTMMNAIVHSSKIYVEKNLDKKTFLIGLLLSVIISFLASSLFIIFLSYKFGGLNLSDWVFVGSPQWPYKYFTAVISSQSRIIKYNISFTLLGGIFMSFLIFMYSRFLWWPFNPVVFPIALTWPMRYQWFSIFLVWMIKSLVLKYGGGKLYKNLIPLFMGIALGELFVSGFWLVIDGFAGITGHVIFSW